MKSKFILLLILLITGAMVLSQSCEIFQITCANPTFSPEKGSVAAGDTITISCKTGLASIYYTLDGTEPDQTRGILYTGPFLLPASATVKAYATRANYNDSARVSADFTIDLSQGNTIAIDSSQPATVIAGPGLKTVTLETGSNTRDVYFVFSNGGTSSSTLPVDYSTTQSLVKPSNPRTGSLPPVPTAAFHKMLPGNPALDQDFNSLRRTLSNSPRAGNRTADTRSKSFQVNDTMTFYGDTSSSNNAQDPVTVVLRYQSGDINTAQGINGAETDAVKTRNLRVWVARDCWTDSNTTSTKAYGVTQAMVDAYATMFLKEGLNNDIYDWVTNIHGPEWGTHPYTNLISPSGNIDIFLYDIDNDNDNYASGNPLVMGYYFARDNFTSSTYSSSNQLLCFSIDAVSFADPRNVDGNTVPWSLSGNSYTCSYWPNEMVSTLAHEFQHMVEFYKNLGDTNDNSSDWSNTYWAKEMVAMCTEDLLGDKIHATGPRGLPYDFYGSYGAGGACYNGRIPEYNYYNENSLIEWDSETKDYAIAYAFGAWLMRNFGGVAIIKEIMDQNMLNASAVVAAVNKITGESWTFEDLLARFGASVLLSDQTNMLSPFSFNSGAASSSMTGNFNSQINGLTYSLGDINFFGFVYRVTQSTEIAGPVVNTAAFSANSSLNPGSNSFYKAAEDMTGNREWNIWLPANTTLTVVVK